jgi:hypothetical protein
MRDKMMALNSMDTVNNLWTKTWSFVIGHEDEDETSWKDHLQLRIFHKILTKTNRSIIIFHSLLRTFLWISRLCWSFIRPPFGSIGRTQVRTLGPFHVADTVVASVKSHIPFPDWLCHTYKKPIYHMNPIPPRQYILHNCNLQGFPHVLIMSPLPSSSQRLHVTLPPQDMIFQWPGPTTFPYFRQQDAYWVELTQQTASLLELQFAPDCAVQKSSHTRIKVPSLEGSASTGGEQSRLMNSFGSVGDVTTTVISDIRMKKYMVSEEEGI